MSSRKLDRLNIDPKICTSLDKIGINTARDLIGANVITIMTSADLSLQDAKILINKVSEKIAGKHMTAFDILNERLQKKCYVSSGITLLDEAMRGGLLVACINEIVGPPGIGKTQFSLGCCIEVLSQHLLDIGFENINNSKKCGIIYFDTELKFDSKRLREMAQNKFPDIFEENVNGPHLLDWLLSRVILKRPSSCKELLEDIESLQTLVISEGIAMVC
jgi:RAD51-like protein 1